MRSRWGQYILQDSNSESIMYLESCGIFQYSQYEALNDVAERSKWSTFKYPGGRARND